MSLLINKYSDLQDWIEIVDNNIRTFTYSNIDSKAEISTSGTQITLLSSARDP